MPFSAAGNLDVRQTKRGATDDERRRKRRSKVSKGLRRSAYRQGSMEKGQTGLDDVGEIVGESDEKSSAFVLERE